MTNARFEEKIKEILKKAEREWYIVSVDPDFVADFGCNAAGQLVIMGETFPLKIADLTDIRYRLGEDESDTFIRFDFGNDFYLDCCYDDCNMGRVFHARYHDAYIWMKYMRETIAFLNTAIKSNEE